MYNKRVKSKNFRYVFSGFEEKPGLEKACHGVDNGGWYCQWERANGYWRAVLMDRPALFLVSHPAGHGNIRAATLDSGVKRGQIIEHEEKPARTAPSSTRDPSDWPVTCMHVSRRQTLRQPRHPPPLSTLMYLSLRIFPDPKAQSRATVLRTCSIFTGTIFPLNVQVSPPGVCARIQVFRDEMCLVFRWTFSQSIEFGVALPSLQELYRISWKFDTLIPWG